MKIKIQFNINYRYFYPEIVKLPANFKDFR